MKLFTRLTLILTLLISTSPSLATECIGSKDLKTGAIYLHGMDTEPPSAKELSNRSSLAAISKSLKIGFSMPRAKNKCPDNRLFCWGWNFNDSESVESAIVTAMNAKAECFPKATSVGLIGFSNGGFVVNQIIKDCRKTTFNWLISIGAGGSQNKNNEKDLSKCGSLILMAGKNDTYNYEPIKGLAGWLKTRGADIKIVEYNDGHVLPEKDLENVLKLIPQK